MDEASKPVMMCRCGKVLESPRAYAEHCEEFPDHFTHSEPEPPAQKPRDSRTQSEIEYDIERRNWVTRTLAG
jgi:hypothetical protein